MNVILKYLIMISFFCALGTKALSQDVLILKNGDRIKCTIIEIFEDRISYLELNDESEILYTISKAKLDSIRLSNGKVIHNVSPSMSDNAYYGDRKRIIKFNFFSLLANVVNINYEIATTPYSSFEISPKLFGYGPSERDISGYGLDLAYKLKMSSIINNPYFPDHILHGGYGRISGGFANINYSNPSSNQKVYHLGLDFGKQWIFMNLVSLDLYFGFHYYYDTYKLKSNFFSYRYPVPDINLGDLFGSNHKAGLAGLKIGILFDRNTNRKKK